MIKVDYCGIAMKTPIIAASGTFGFGLEYEPYVNLNKIGAISVKGLTFEPRAGNEGVRIAETASGILNCIGLENPGVEAFITEIMPQLAKYDVPILANISGNTVEEYGEMASILKNSGIDGLEVNISCPNVKNGCLAFGVDTENAAAVTRAVKKNTNLPVVVKLSPNVTDIAAIAIAVEAAGADGISLVNTFLGMVIDAKRRRPLLGNITGGLSGPCIKPLALRMVWEVAQAVKIPICGMGGIMNGKDAVEFMLAGATTVSVGTATMVDPTAVERIGTEIECWCRENGVCNINEIIGGLIL